MALSGHTQELSLPDLIQVKAAAGGTCHVTVEGPAGPGEIYLEQGTVVHARYGGLEGEDAAYALFAEPEVYFETQSHVPIPRRTMARSAQGALMEAMRLQDEGSVPATTTPRGNVVSLPRRPGATAEDDEPADHERSFPLVPVAIGAVVVAILAVGALFLLGASGDDAPAEPVPASTSEGNSATASERPPVEASELMGPRDALPVLVEGAPPASPDPDSPLQPTIICRILVDGEGRVVEARVFRPRADLESFEQVALEAVRGYRFEPARREGVVVPVWINWPVEFS